MGSACCVAARDKTIINDSVSENLHRTARYSPTWSLQWDNRGRVAGEDTSISWLSDGVSRNDGSGVKFESTDLLEEGSSFESVHRGAQQKSPVSEGNTWHMRTPASDQSISRDLSMDVFLEQVRESTESPEVSYSSLTKPSLPLHSSSSWTTSPLSSQNHFNLASLTPSRCPIRSPAHRLIRQVSDSRILGFKSPNSYSISEERSVLFPWSNESMRGSRDGSSDRWSMYAFSELVATSHGERWSSDSESVLFNREKITQSNSRISASPSVDFQKCRICSKLLNERASGRSTDLSVVSVLICGHVFHAECLESLTPEFNKYDPACPVCTFGEKHIFKLSEKALKAELDLKARIMKRSRKKVVDSDLSCSSIGFDNFKAIEHELKGPKMASSSSMRSSLTKPFLKRHFSFGSKGSSKPFDNHNTKKKGFFWTKSNRE